MIRPVALGLVAALAFAAAGSAVLVATPAAAQAAAYSSKSNVGELLDNPETKAALLKIIPAVINNPMIEMGRGFALADLAQYEPALTPAVLAQIDAALAPIKKK